MELVNKLIKYAYDYDFYDFMNNVNENTTDEIYKALTSNKRDLINSLKLDIFESSDNEQIQEAKRLINEVSNF